MAIRKVRVFRRLVCWRSRHPEHEGLSLCETLSRDHESRIRVDHEIPEALRQAMLSSVRHYLPGQLSCLAILAIDQLKRETAVHPIYEEDVDQRHTGETQWLVKRYLHL